MFVSAFRVIGFLLYKQVINKAGFYKSHANDGVFCFGNALCYKGFILLGNLHNKMIKSSNCIRPSFFIFCFTDFFATS